MGNKKCVTVARMDDVTLTVMKLGNCPWTVSLAHSQVMLFRGVPRVATLQEGTLDECSEHGRRFMVGLSGGTSLGC